MRILLTNDDGIDSSGLQAVQRAFEQDHDIWIVAPDGERSGCAQSLTLREAIRTRQREERVFVCSGTPVDCVNLACSDLLPDPPDLVISGINLGPNIGSDIGYSGTAAAARQGAYMGVPSIAISVFGSGAGLRFGAALSFLETYGEEMAEKWRTGYYYNINTPDTDAVVTDVVVSEVAETRYNSTTESFVAPGNERYHFYQGELITSDAREGTDLHTVLSGMISVSYICTVPAVVCEPEAVLEFQSGDAPEPL